VAGLADQIQALRAANAVDAAPERTVTRKAARAEWPVTARLRERMTEDPVQVVPEPAAGEAKVEPVQKPQEPPTAPPAAVLALPEPVKLTAGYRGDVNRLRQANAAQMRLF
jgi:hypothetical protein